MKEFLDPAVWYHDEEFLAKLKKMDEEEEERKKRNQKYKDIARRHREMKRARKLRGRQLKSGKGKEL